MNNIYVLSSCIIIKLFSSKSRIFIAISSTMHINISYLTRIIKKKNKIEESYKIYAIRKIRIKINIIFTRKKIKFPSLKIFKYFLYNKL
jgi:hypothetical protein